MDPQKTLIWLIVSATLLPLASSAAVIFLGRRVLKRGAGWFATGIMAASFACAVGAMVLWQRGSGATIVWSLPWVPIPGGWFYVGAIIDSLSVAMVAMVSLISTLVHLYSIGYMAGDSRYERFFAYLSLFTFSMLGIVIANSVMQLFIMWELVGLTSYLLIGFWFERRGPQLACKKAFVMNRIGDTGFLIGFGILFYKLGGSLLLPAAGEGGLFESIGRLLEVRGYSITNPPVWLTAAGIGLFCGAIGKSAQFPLHTWLPDAMEGPTPVSSIVHSATMVAAGVYLTARIYPILTPGAHLFIATIGLVTLVMAACMALVMTDIKRVLAYSTLSQLGYMILGLGVGAYAFALYHLIIHAFFKCCLFQCAGSVIQGAHHQQDLRHFGGLWRKLPVTALCYFVCMLCIAGASLPLTAYGLAAFYSKDGILAGAVHYGRAMEVVGGWAAVFWIAPLAVAYITPFYMARSFALTFLGQPRDRHLYEHAHEAPVTMLVPQLALATGAVLSGWYLWLKMIVASEPAIGWVQTARVIEDTTRSHGLHTVHLGLLFGFGWAASLLVGLAMYWPGMRLSSRVVAVPGVNLLYRWALNKFYFDALYDGFAVGAGKAGAAVAGWFDRTVVDGLVNFGGWLGQWAAAITGAFDNVIVDGAMNGAATLAHNSGEALRSTQVGRLRVYVMLVFGSLAAVGLLVVLLIAVR